jgi:hypothetical protein
MTDLRAWQLAFLKQARSDWDAYKKIDNPTWPYCHRLHFMQMTAEKLGKALLIGGDMTLEQVTHTHASFVKFMRIARNNRNLQNELGMTPSQLKAHFNRLLPIAYEIEALAPALAQGGPNPEYPWLDNSGKILVPVDYSFTLIKLLHSPQGAQLLKYIGHFFMDFEKLFLKHQ